MQKNTFLSEQKAIWQMFFEIFFSCLTSLVGGRWVCVYGLKWYKYHTVWFRSVQSSAVA